MSSWNERYDCLEWEKRAGLDFILRELIGWVKVRTAFLLHKQNAPTLAPTCVLKMLRWRLRYVFDKDYENTWINIHCSILKNDKTAKLQSTNCFSSVLFSSICLLNAMKDDNFIRTISFEDLFLFWAVGKYITPPCPLVGVWVCVCGWAQSDTFHRGTMGDPVERWPTFYATQPLHDKPSGADA